MKKRSGEPRPFPDSLFRFHAQFGEDAVGRLGMQEGDHQAFGPFARRLVDGAYALGLRLVDGGLDADEV